MDNKMISMLGRIIFGLPFGLFGLIHLFNAQAMAVMVPSYFPGPGSFWVSLTGLVFLAVGLAFLFNKYIKEAASLLAFQLLVFILVIHVPGTGSEDPVVQQMSMTQLLKDTALLGGALTYVAWGKKSAADNHTATGS